MTVQQFNPVFKSGDEIGTDVRCYDCGKRFADSYLGEDVGEFVLCDCGGRGAYVVEYEYLD